MAMSSDSDSDSSSDYSPGLRLFGGRGSTGPRGGGADASMSADVHDAAPPEPEPAPSSTAPAAAAASPREGSGGGGELAAELQEKVQELSSERRHDALEFKASMKQLTKVVEKEQKKIECLYESQKYIL